MPQPARCFCVRDRFVADDAFWIAIIRHPRNINERKRPKTDKKYFLKRTSSYFHFRAVPWFSRNNVVMETHVRSGYDEAWPASRLYCRGTKRMSSQSVTSHKEIDTINELFGVDLVWFDTIQKG